MSNAHFDGVTFDASLDGSRLTSQLERVRAFMADGQWHTLTEIANSTGGTLPAVSARLRDLRKRRFGTLVVEHRRVPGSDGLFEYRVPVGQTPDYTGASDSPVDVSDGDPDMPTAGELKVALDELRVMLNHPALKEQRKNPEHGFSPTFTKVTLWLASKAAGATTEDT